MHSSTVASSFTPVAANSSIPYVVIYASPSVPASTSATTSTSSGGGASTASPGSSVSGPVRGPGGVTESIGSSLASSHTSSASVPSSQSVSTKTSLAIPSIVPTSGIPASVLSSMLPGYAIIPSPSATSGSQGMPASIPAGYTTVSSNAPSATPVYTPSMLGSAYGGGFVSSPSVFVALSSPVPATMNTGVPPGYGVSIIIPGPTTNVVPPAPPASTTSESVMTPVAPANGTNSAITSVPTGAAPTTSLAGGNASVSVTPTAPPVYAGSARKETLALSTIFAGLLLVALFV
ncbi:hypothetical protein LTR04_002495 [Oleoguttula sp. CCFEE 6159]|nr:hypothetical protein LTR04_002495 [Oleoguttula sp. CCFEE 6159]